MKSRVKLENLARKKGITQIHEKTTETLIELLLTNHKFNRKELNITASNLDIKKPHRKNPDILMNAFNRFRVDRKLNELGLTNWTRRYISLIDIDRITKVNELSHDTLKKLGELQQIKNYNTLPREELIYALLRSQNPNEHNYIPHITENIDLDNIDNEIRPKINDIRQTVTRLGNLLSNK